MLRPKHMDQEIQNTQQNTRLLFVENLCDVKPGYHWYEDNSFSKEIIVGKPLKAVVVLVLYGVIYGDIFQEESCSQEQLEKVMKSLSEKVNQKLCLLPLVSHERISLHIDKVNAALQNCEKSIWKGEYWTATEYACYDLWVYSYPSKRQTPGRRSSYKLRPVIGMPVV